MSANDELQAHTCEKILQECGDVANNVVQPKVQDLTEQWKNGELEGEYYIETRNGEIYNVEFQNSISVKKKKLLKVKSFKGYVHKKTVKEVLAPVPSYEEWRRLQNSWVDEMSKAVDLQKALEWSNEQYNTKVPVLESENQQLKELLQESKDIIEWYKGDCGYKDTPTEAILTKIDNAIGEKNNGN